jgi:adenylate cyclase
MERRLAAIMAGDVVGYSRLMAADEAGTYDHLRAALDDTVLPTVERHGGRVFKTTGDGFLAAFASATDALSAAVAIQAGFAGRPLQLRLGLNLGDVIQEDGDVFGDGVNVAARLEAMAEPGGICASAAVVRGAGRRPDLRFRRQGLRRGKNLPDPIEVYAVEPAASGRRLPVRRIGALAAGVAALAVALAAWRYGEPLNAVVADWLPTSGAAVAEDFGNRPAVAVLPFDNLGGDPAQDWFSDGLTEDIITELARNPELMVIARNSTFAFKDRPTDVREIGARLGARYVVEGSSRRAGDQLRVVAQLIDAGSGAHLWSRSYDRRLADVFAVQTEVTREIVASLVSYVQQSESAAVAQRPTESLQAYELVLQGRQRLQEKSADDAAAHEAQALFGRAVALDPDYAAARANLGLALIVEHLGEAGGDKPGTELEEGLLQAREAVRLAPDLPLAFQVLSYGLSASGDYAGGMRAAERAVELNPSDPDSLMALAKAQVRFGAYEDAVQNAALARRLHPMAPDYYPYVHAQALYAAGQLDDARSVLEDCLLAAPSEPNCLRIAAAALARLDRAADAKAAMQRLLAAEPTFSLTVERRLRRFGDSPVMERYLADLALAGAPPGAGQAARPTVRAAT